MLTSGRVPNGILLNGQRGIGKTTIARIFAKAVNCQNMQEGAEPCGVCPSCQAGKRHPDIREIDGASNGNIDDIRLLLSDALLCPSLSRKKVYIIDEAHNLGRSVASWDALLKILEEPPTHVLWIFCTTQKHKIPDVIKSRLVSLDLRVVPAGIILGQLVSVTAREWPDVDIMDPVVVKTLGSISRAANNSIRDALTILEKVGTGGLWKSSLDFISGFVDDAAIEQFLSCVARQDGAGLWGLLSGLLENGNDPAVILDSLIIESLDAMLSIAMGIGVERPEIYTGPYQAIGLARLRYLIDTVMKRYAEFLVLSSKKLFFKTIALELTL
jgi:DNA polymerase III subunit gamma/tau